MSGHSAGSTNFECEALCASEEKGGLVWSGARAGTQPKLAARPLWDSSVGLGEKRRKGGNTTGTPGLGVAMSHLGYSSTNCTCARKNPVSNCERQHEITDF